MAEQTEIDLKGTKLQLGSDGERLGMMIKGEDAVRRGEILIEIYAHALMDAGHNVELSRQPASDGWCVSFKPHEYEHKGSYQDNYPLQSIVSTVRNITERLASDMRYNSFYSAAERTLMEVIPEEMQRDIYRERYRNRSPDEAQTASLPPERWRNAVGTGLYKAGVESQNLAKIADKVVETLGFSAHIVDKEWMLGADAIRPALSDGLAQAGIPPQKIKPLVDRIVREVNQAEQQHHKVTQR